ncbi:MAG: YbaB/EbfC family nucleoid-associated protein [Maioricimonas sp. JB045]
MFKGFANLAGMVKGVQELQGRMGQMQERLANIQVEGTAGGGMVVATMNGQQKLLSCRIEPSLLASGDSEMIEELVVSAVNLAAENAREAAANEMASLTGDLDMPGLDQALAKFGFGDNGQG